MRWRIVAVGRPKLPFARDGIHEYLARLKHFTPIEVETLKASSVEKEALQLLHASEGCYRIVLDERGDSFTSRTLATRLMDIGTETKTCALIVGSADGLAPIVRSEADLIWSLSDLTLQHELALMIALEQIYRACTIQAGLPYHRD